MHADGWDFFYGNVHMSLQLRLLSQIRWPLSLPCATCTTFQRLCIDFDDMQSWCLDACKSKAKEIMSAASTVHPEAMTRVVSCFPQEI